MKQRRRTVQSVKLPQLPPERGAARGAGRARGHRGPAGALPAAAASGGREEPRAAVGPSASGTPAPPPHPGDRGETAGGNEDVLGKKKPQSVER